MAKKMVRLKYYQNGHKKEEGWFKKNKKSGYWHFYSINSKKIKEGHYSNNTPKMWWKYYKKNSLEKCIFKKDGKTRYCLIYDNEKLIKGSKYISDTFIQEWNSLSNFKRDNPDFSF